MLFSGGGTGLFGGRDLAQITANGFVEQQSVGGCPVDVNAAHHFIFGAPGPVLCVAFCAEGFDCGRPFAHADHRLLRVGRSLGNGCHLIPPDWAVYRVIRGLKSRKG